MFQMAILLLVLVAMAAVAVATDGKKGREALEAYLAKGKTDRAALVEALMAVEVAEDDEANWGVLDSLAPEDVQELFRYMASRVFEMMPPQPVPEDEYRAAMAEMVAKHVGNSKRNVDPVVFIPGFLASAVNCHKNRANPLPFCPGNRPEYQCWLSIPKIVRLRCFFNEFSRTFASGEYGYKMNYPDFYTDGIDFGGVDGVEAITKFLGVPIMGGMIAAFEAVGYQRDISFRAATYDWTFAGGAYEDDDSVQAVYAKLRELVEETYRLNGNRRVNLMGHSMGTYMGHWFLSSYVNQTWKDTYVKNMIDITPLYKGAPLSHRALLTGLTPIPLIKWYLRNLVTNWGSLHFFLPFNWNNTDFVITDGGSYQDTDTVALYNDAGRPHVGQAYPLAHAVTSRMVPHGVPYHCFVCTNITTECGVDYRGTRAPRFWYETPVSIPCDGDVLVPTYSATACQTLNPATFQTYAGVNHLAILNHIPFLDVVIGICTA